VSGDERGRRLVDRARKAAPAPRRRRARSAPEEQPWSGPGADERDPAPLGSSMEKFVQDRDWEQSLRANGLLGRWEHIVGPAIAAHCRPDRLTDGELVCVAESTTWAAAIRLETAEILAKIAADVGPGVVQRLRVHGPTAPSWQHGPLRVRGRGPRDTYG
jgi:predicted nucleic acid-binding Zn ribbon protein